MLDIGSTIGIIGGGQLGRMMAAAAKQMGFDVAVLDPTPNCPAAQVSDFHIEAGYDDVAALAELAAMADVLTYEFENVDADALDKISGATLPQGTDLLRTTQDRRAEKQFLTDAGVPVAPYLVVNRGDDVTKAARTLGYPCVLKTARGGYDGKGQVVLRGEGDLQRATALANQADCVLEALVPFESELSVLVVANEDGQVRVFPPIHNEHRNNILHVSTIPAQVPEASARKAEDVAREIAKRLGLVGVLAIEMFYLPNGEVVVNELAPRPHNSGHATIEACDFSQFDMHIRAVAGWPLPQPALLSPAVMLNLLGEDMGDVMGLVKHHPDFHLHVYGKKDAKVGRKMGHVTALGEPAATREALTAPRP